MDDIMTIVAERLFGDRKDANKLHYCIRTMFETIAKEPVRNCKELTHRMQSLGWDDFVMDEHTFKLVMLALKDS